VFGFVEVWGTPGDDTLIGNARNNALYGVGGFDTVDGRAGTDDCTGEVVTNCETG
jgi:Ca2+-binding RTX toxin-like protein